MSQFDGNRIRFVCQEIGHLDTNFNNRFILDNEGVSSPKIALAQFVPIAAIIPNNYPSIPKRLSHCTQ